MFLVQVLRPALALVALAAAAGCTIRGPSQRIPQPAGGEAGTSTPASVTIPNDRALVAATYTNRGLMTRITQTPVPMDPRVARLCMGPEGRPHQDPHSAYSVHVSVSAAQADAFRQGTNSFPAGTMIVKEKLHGLGGGPSADLFTGMLKREPGYNASGGDWEWFVVAGSAGLLQVVARGQLTSCLDCHEKHRATGFITSRYP